MPSVVIPAHDERQKIGQLLEALSPLAGEVVVVVVCNGCSDDTAAVARSAAAWATVLDLPEASKPAALDAGDAAAADAFPRLYLDADVGIDADSVRALLRAVAEGRPAAAATPVYDMEHSRWTVRSHYRIWTRMAANTGNLYGTGAMAVTREGRARFTNWPRLMGDDYFLDGIFAPDEKVRLAEAAVILLAPRGFIDCVSRKARVHQGNLDVRGAGLRPQHGEGGLRAAARAVADDPRLAVHLPAHVAASVAARGLAAWRRRRGTARQWHRDGSRR